MHSIVATASLPLFLGALLADWAYARSFQVQWTNFASWLIAGALVLAALALVWAAVDTLRMRAPRERRSWVYLGLLIATCLIGFLNALVHARDGWAAMPSGLILSLVALLLAAAAAAYGLSGLARRVP